MRFEGKLIPRHPVILPEVRCFRYVLGPISGKGQLVVKVDDLLSQQTRNHQPDTRPVIKPDLAKSQGSKRPEHSGDVSLRSTDAPRVLKKRRNLYETGGGNSSTNLDHSTILLSPAQPKPRHRICHRGR